MLVLYQFHLIATELFPEDADTDAFRFNSITRKEFISFVNYPDVIALIISIDDTTTTQPSNTGLVDNFKVDYFLADSLKHSVKKDTRIFTTFNEGQNWMIGTGISLRY